MIQFGGSIRNLLSLPSSGIEVLFRDKGREGLPLPSMTCSITLQQIELIKKRSSGSNAALCWKASHACGSTQNLESCLQERGFSSHASYSLSKLASQFFTKDLSERVKGRGLTANCLDPGTVNTKMLYAGWGPCGISIKASFECEKLLM